MWQIGFIFMLYRPLHEIQYKNCEVYGAHPKHQVLEHQLLKHQFLKHQLSKTSIV